MTNPEIWPSDESYELAMLKVSKAFEKCKRGNAGQSVAATVGAITCALHDLQHVTAEGNFPVGRLSAVECLAWIAAESLLALRIMMEAQDE